MYGVLQPHEIQTVVCSACIGGGGLVVIGRNYGKRRRRDVEGSVYLFG